MLLLGRIWRIERALMLLLLIFGGMIDAREVIGWSVLVRLSLKLIIGSWQGYEDMLIVAS